MRSLSFDENSVALPDLPARKHWTLAGRSRVRLVAATTVLLVAAGALAATAAPSTVESDLARLLRFMAILKGSFALAAFAAGYWRLARPATPWRASVYVLAPGLIGAGAIGLGFLQGAGIATLVLHAGMFAWLGAALTDPDFIPALRRR